MHNFDIIIILIIIIITTRPRPAFSRLGPKDPHLRSARVPCSRKLPSKVFSSQTIYFQTRKNAGDQKDEAVVVVGCMIALQMMPTNPNAVCQR